MSDSLGELIVENVFTQVVADHDTMQVVWEGVVTALYAIAESEPDTARYAEFALLAEHVMMITNVTIEWRDEP